MQKIIAYVPWRRDDLAQGMNIILLRIDSPDGCKQNPLYEDTGLNLYQHHYYDWSEEIS